MKVWESVNRLIVIFHFKFELPFIDIRIKINNQMGNENAEFNWIQMRKDVGLSEEEITVETFSEKFRRKFNEDPLVPVGK